METVLHLPVGFIYQYINMLLIVIFFYLGLEQNMFKSQVFKIKLKYFQKWKPQL